MTTGSSILSSPERPESYQPHHSSLNLSATSNLSAAADNVAKEEGIIPVNSVQAKTGTGTTKKRKRTLIACIAIPVVFYAIYGAVASTQDLIWLLRGDNDVGSTANDQSDGVMSNGKSEGRDTFDGSITAETPAQHDISTQRSSNPFFALLAGATFQPTAQDAIGLSSYLSNVAGPHSKFNPRTQLPVMWTPGAPNYGYSVTKIHHCLDIVQASYLGRAEEGTYWDDLRVVEGDAEDRGRYIDVDMSTLHGIQRAKDQNLVDSGLADIIISPFLPEVLDLFSSSNNHHPRLMIVLEDTKKRVKASYTYLHGKGLFDGSYLEFISSEHILVNDYLVRMLSGQWDVSVELTRDDLHVAVQELQSKFHVGVLRHIRTYMEQMVSLMGWQQPPPADVVDCMFPPKYDNGPQPKPEETELETQMREIVRNKNRWDVQLLNIFAKRWDEGAFSR